VIQICPKGECTAGRRLGGARATTWGGAAAWRGSFLRRCGPDMTYAGPGHPLPHSERFELHPSAANAFTGNAPSARSIATSPPRRSPYANFTASTRSLLPLALCSLPSKLHAPPMLVSLRRPLHPPMDKVRHTLPTAHHSINTERLAAPTSTHAPNFF